MLRMETALKNLPTPVAPPKDGRAYVALLAGGVKHFHKILAPMLLTDFGIDLKYHWDYPKPGAQKIPDDVELVCICTNAINHPASVGMVKAAKAAGVHFAQITRNRPDCELGLGRAGFPKHPAWLAASRAVLASVDDEQARRAAASPHARQRAKDTGMPLPPVADEEAAPPEPVVESVAATPAPPPAPVIVAADAPLPRYLPYKLTPWDAKSDQVLQGLCETIGDPQEVIERLYRETGVWRHASGVGLHVGAWRHLLKWKNPNLISELSILGRKRAKLRHAFLAAEVARDEAGQPAEGEWVSRDLATAWFNGSNSRFTLCLDEGFYTLHVDRTMDLAVVQLDGAMKARFRINSRMRTDKDQLLPRYKLDEEEITRRILDQIRRDAEASQSGYAALRSRTERCLAIVAQLVKNGKLIPRERPNGGTGYTLPGLVSKVPPKPTTPVTPAPPKPKREEFLENAKRIVGDGLPTSMLAYTGTDGTQKAVPVSSATAQRLEIYRDFKNGLIDAETMKMLLKGLD